MNRITLLLLILLSACNRNSAPKSTISLPIDTIPKTKKTELQSISSFIPYGYRFLKEYTGDLNNDGLEDKLLLIEQDTNIKKDSSSKVRPLLILLGQKDQSLKEIARNDFVIFDDEATAYGGDAFDIEDGIKIEKGKFTISYFYHIFNELSSQQFIFKYDETKNDWFLTKQTFNSDMDNQVSDDTTTVSDIYTAKDFGSISFRNYRKKMTTNRTTRKEMD